MPPDPEPAPCWDKGWGGYDADGKVRCAVPVALSKSKVGSPSEFPAAKTQISIAAALRPRVAPAGGGAVVWHMCPHNARQMRRIAATVCVGVAVTGPGTRGTFHREADRRTLWHDISGHLLCGAEAPTKPPASPPKSALGVVEQTCH